MQAKKILLISLLGGLLIFSSGPAFAKRRSRAKKYSTPITNPVLLWARTLSESQDLEERKVAAFKLSQYSQSLYQDEVVTTLIKCIKDPDEHIKVFCAKAMGKAGSKSKADTIRRSLLEQYKQDPKLRGTLIRTFIVRKDNHSSTQEALLETLKQSSEPDELLPLLDYLEQFGSSQSIAPLISAFQKSDNSKIRRGVVKALSEKGQGQDSVVNLLIECSESRDTTLVLTCLSALQAQAKKDSKTLAAVEKTIESSDPDVILASLDVIQALPESPNPKISNRLIELIEQGGDTDLLENSILALGICGDFSEPAIKVIQTLLEKKDVDEGIKISAALVLGKQAEKFPEGPKAVLTACRSSAATQSLKTACQLGLQELQRREKKIKVTKPVDKVGDQETKPEKS